MRSGEGYYITQGVHINDKEQGTHYRPLWNTTGDRNVWRRVVAYLYALISLRVIFLGIIVIVKFVNKEEM